MSIDLFCVIISPSSTKERMEMGIFRFLRCFSRMYENGDKYKAKRIGERIDPWPTSMLTSKSEDSKSFQT